MSTSPFAVVKQSTLSQDDQRDPQRTVRDQLLERGTVGGKRVRSPKIRRRLFADVTARSQQHVEVR